ncbi:putative nonribosomal peptide synthase [Stipitochalara longipes BDJ]|nr:putative nonribosomal peptide synthase [Stipitochalara longipes BDJ]
MDVAAWSLSRIEAALSQLGSHVAIVTSPCPGLQLPVITVNFQKEWLCSPSMDENNDNDSDLCAQLDVLRNGLRADDLAWIIFTSGTTGKPKGVMVYHRAIYEVCIVKHSSDLESAAQEGGRCLLAFSIAFDGCAAVVWTTLTKGGTLAMASPSNFPEVASNCDLLNLTPSMLAALDPSGPYDGVRYIFLGAEAPNLDIVRQWIRPNRKVLNTYGPSETTCVISFAELSGNEEPPFGDLIPGVRVVLVDEKLQECDHGEVLIAGPGLAAGYLNNPELTAQKFIQWDGERFYRTGDLARRTANGQLVWAGRADSLVKNRGFLINLETEVEPALMSSPLVRIAVAFKWREKLVGCIQPATVDVDELREFMNQRFDPFVVPDEIVALDSFPLNVNGKTDRRALEEQLEERIRISQEAESLFNSGEHISGYDALRLAFSKCLHVASKDLDKDSSFTRLGGNSLAAIRLCNLLKRHGYFLSVIQILKRDTIGRLEDILQSLPDSGALEQDVSVQEGTSEEAPPALDVQKLFLARSLQNPIQCALIGITKYVGDPRTAPTAKELHEAVVKALSAHSIFQTRFDLTNFTLSDLGRLNLDWHEVGVEEAEFENACGKVEEQAWLDLKGITRFDNEVPYCHVTCVSVPDRKAIAFITRVHHVLTDVHSAAILSRDVERALAGEEIPQGPHFQDLARFMHKYKQENLERAIYTFENMLKLLPATSVLQPPGPRTPPLEQAFDLIRLAFPTAISKAALDASARNYSVTTSTMVYAAWALFLSKITGWDRVGFSVSQSGRTVPWPSAESIVGPLLCRSLFSTAISPDATVHEWLAEVHKTTLDVLEFDGLYHALPDSLMVDPRTNTTNVLCFLDVPQPSSNWVHSDKQRHNYLMDWYIFQDGEGVRTEFEIQSRYVDLDWAKEVGGIPGRMLEGFVNSAKETLVGDLLR